MGDRKREREGEIVGKARELLFVDSLHKCPQRPRMGRGRSLTCCSIAPPIFFIFALFATDKYAYMFMG